MEDVTREMKLHAEAGFQKVIITVVISVVITYKLKQ